jgi:hypothetical protein
MIRPRTTLLVAVLFLVIAAIYYVLSRDAIGTTLFVATYVYLSREAPPGASAPRRALVALVIGAATAAVVTLVFERVFLVRLP